LLEAKLIRAVNHLPTAPYGQRTGSGGHKLFWDEKKLNVAVARLIAQRATRNVASYGHI